MKDDLIEPAFAAVDPQRLVPADGGVRITRHTLADDDGSGRTAPWHDDELLHAGSLALIYTVDTAGRVEWVHLPGGGRIDVRALQSLGFEVKLPRTVRDGRRRLKRSRKRDTVGGSPSSGRVRGG